MGSLFHFKLKPDKITQGHFLRWICTVLLLLMIFYGASRSYQKKVQNLLIQRLNYPAQASLTYQNKPLIPVPDNLPIHFPNWFYSEEVKAVKIKFQFKSTPVDTLLGIDSLTSLSCLDLSYSRFSGDQLVYLSDVTSLDELSFYDTNVEDAELAYLKNMKSLRILRLHDNLITDKGLVHLKGLKDLEYLSLSETEITDAGLVHLSKLKNLRNLFLNETAVTDKGLVHLMGLKNLTILGLNNTKITDEGLSSLNGLSNLQKLSLNNTNVTENEKRRWRIVLELRASKNEEKEIQVKSRFPSEMSVISHTH